MSKVCYSKPALTLQEQVEQLRNRGMVIADEPLAIHYLGHLNYYRLAAYWLPFEADHQNHTFIAGTTFEQILDRYVFDRELRLLLIDAIERVEVALRTQFAYQLSHVYGAHFLLQSGLFQAQGRNWSYLASLNQLVSDVANSRERFISHLNNKYSEPLPPVWAVVEIMTLGQLSKWYANLTGGADRNRVAHHFDFDEVTLVSFMHHLAVVRNYCAHHSRVWNRDFTFTFKLPKHRPGTVIASLNRSAPKKLYNTLVLLACLLDQISPGHHWKQRLKHLFNDHSIPEQEMGFPANWQQLPIWQ